jgi:hypothetical protein
MDKIEKLDYKKMLRDILKLVDTDFCMDMEMKLGYRKSGSKEMIDVRKYTQEEARIMAEKLARVYRISHGVYCSACNWKYRIEDQKQPEGISETIDQKQRRVNQMIQEGMSYEDAVRIMNQPEGVEYEKRVRVLGELSGNKKHIEAHKEFLKLPEGVMDGYVETVGTPVLESTTTYSNTEPERVTEKQVTDFVKHTDRNRELNRIADQSQKQPEGEVPIMKVEDENGSYWVADNHIEEYPKEPELLSERTFTLEELIKITQMFSHYEVCSGGLMEEDRKIVEKISKLLEKEEE